MTILNSRLLATAATALLVATPGAFAQTAYGSEDMEQMIEAADAPDTAETDPVNETASNEIGGANDERMTGDNAGQTVVLDVESFAQQIYERGYRQGYVSGVSDMRERIAQQMMMQRHSQQQRQMMQGNRQQAQSGQSGQQSGQSGQMSGADNQTAQAGETDIRRPGDGPISDELAARPGGSIVILPPGVSPEAFISQLMEDRQSDG